MVEKATRGTLTHVVHWEAKLGWQHIDVEEAEKIYDGKTVRSSEQVLMCSLCHDYVTLTRSSAKRPAYFKHKRMEQKSVEDCPDRSGNKESISHSKVSLKDAKLPLRLEEHGSKYSLKLGILPEYSNLLEFEIIKFFLRIDIMTHTLLFANFKGGVGKTTNSVMTAYELSKLGYKTLVCDLDPQANATQLLRRTYTLQHNEEMAFPETMMVALKNENIKPAIVEVMKNLYLLPSHKDFVNYPDFLELKYLANMPNYKERRISYFNNQLKQVQNEYDFIIIDVPPTLSIYTDSALYAADNVIIVLQTQQRSLDGAIAFWEYLQTFYNEHSTIDFDILGILPVLLKNNAGLDNQIIKDAKETFGDDLLFNTIIKHMERLKRYDRLGISEKGKTSKHDFHDEKTHEIYIQLTKEILNRLKEKEHA